MGGTTRERESVVDGWRRRWAIGRRGGCRWGRPSPVEEEEGNRVFGGKAAVGVSARGSQALPFARLHRQHEMRMMRCESCWCCWSGGRSRSSVWLQRPRFNLFFVYTQHTLAVLFRPAAVGACLANHLFTNDYGTYKFNVITHLLFGYTTELISLLYIFFFKKISIYCKHIN